MIELRKGGADSCTVQWISREVDGWCRCTYYVPLFNEVGGCCTPTNYVPLFNYVCRNKRTTILVVYMIGKFYVDKH